MGKTEVTEYVEVVEKEKVHICDFCGRDSDNFDESFEDVDIDNKLKAYKDFLQGYTRDIPVGPQTIDDNQELIVDRWKTNINDYFFLESEQTLHLCPECYAAHTEELQ